MNIEHSSEECPVCWRTYSTTLVPTSIHCGHTRCIECCTVLRKCPLCRSRISSSSNRVTNYALLSLIERIDKGTKKDTREICIQTEKIQRQRKQRVETVEPSIPISTSGSMNKGITLKLKNNKEGVVNCFELKFK